MPETDAARQPHRIQGSVQFRVSVIAFVQEVQEMLGESKVAVAHDEAETKHGPHANACVYRVFP